MGREVSARIVSCPTCLYRAEWTEAGEEIACIQEGGGRGPAVPRNYATWQIWARARAGESGPVAGACPRCGLPAVADGGPPDAPWTVDTPWGPLEMGAEVLRGPRGPMTDDKVEALFAELNKTDVVAEVFDFRTLFLIVVIGIFALIALWWVGAAAFVLNFLYAMGTQGNFSAPSVP